MLSSVLVFPQICTVDYRRQNMVFWWMMMMKTSAVMPALHICDVSCCQHMTSVSTGSPGCSLFVPHPCYSRRCCWCFLSIKKISSFQLFQSVQIFNTYFFFFMFRTCKTEIPYFLICKLGLRSISKTNSLSITLFHSLFDPFCRFISQLQLQQLWGKPWEEDPEFRELKKEFYYSSKRCCY